MTDDQINVTIAECCGWTRLHASGPYNILVGIPPGTEESIYNWEYPPQYCTDLNAMAQAEQTLDEREQPMYYSEIYKQSQEYEVTKCASFDLVTVSARQRAEAFLRVKGLWREEAPEFGCQNIVTKG